jgi:hypothetical protein
MKINRLTVSTNDYDSFTEIVTISVDLGRAYYAPYSKVKTAIEEIESVINDQVKIPVYDCTGRPFTTDIERVSRFAQGNNLVYILKHSISIDC